MKDWSVTRLSLVSYIGISTLVLIIIIGSIIKIKTKRKVDDLEGFCGITIIEAEKEKTIK